MSQLFERHQVTLRSALGAIRTRGYWSAYPEVPSGKVYGETARQEGTDAYQALLGRAFGLPEHPGSAEAGAEVSPFGGELGIRYPAADADTLVAASKQAASAWANASIEARTGVCLEILSRLNRRSFEMAHAVMNTSGQAFPMAFQAGGPHAQDRALEAVAYAWEEMKRVPVQASWVKPLGRGQQIELDKHWKILPRGVSVVIGCQTFPTWNSYPGIFASLMTGNTVIAKPHPGAILPMALTVSVARAVLREQGFPADAVLLGAENPGGTLAKDLALHQDVALIDFTGSGAFGQWLRTNAATPWVFTEEAGVNGVVIGGTQHFAEMCDNLAFSLALYSGQMCTTPQNFFIPRDGIDTDEGHQSFDEVANGLADAVNRLLADPVRAGTVAGAIGNPDTLVRIEKAREKGRVIRESAALPASGKARTATPLLVALDADDTAVYGEECFGPIAYLVAVKDVDEGIERAASLAADKGAITAALYDTDEGRIARAIEVFGSAGVNLSINLLGGIYVNQSAAFSDFHVTGANPAGNASFTDSAFVANRFRVVMWRRLVQD
ncbi:MAG: phenylacetic acid degradation protein PaaN [Lautropia sp.]|nr:phenylacetic acid degradation protein PaaN [Lautropia sp.]